MVAACATGMGVSWNVANVGAAANSVAIHYGIALATVGLFTAALFAAELVSMSAIGPFTDRRGARFVGLTALAICVVGNLLTLVLDGIGIALVLRFIVGFGVGLGFVGGTAYVQQLGGETLAQSIYGGLSLATGGIAVAVIPSLESGLGWQAPFVTAAVIAGVAMMGVLLGSSARAATGGELMFVRLLGDRRLLRFAAVQSATFGLGIVVSNWIVTLLSRRGDYSVEEAGLIGALILLVGVIGRPGGGLYAHLRPAHVRTLLRLALITGAFGSILLGIAPPTALAVMGAVMVGLAAGIPFGPIVAGLGRTFRAAPGAAFAAMNFYGLMVIILGTPLMGVTFSLPGDGLIGFAAVALFWLLAALVMPSRQLLLGPNDGH